MLLKIAVWLNGKSVVVNIHLRVGNIQWRLVLKDTRARAHLITKINGENNLACLRVQSVHYFYFYINFITDGIKLPFRLSAGQV